LSDGHDTISNGSNTLLHLGDSLHGGSIALLENVLERSFVRDAPESSSAKDFLARGEVSLIMGEGILHCLTPVQVIQ